MPQPFQSIKFILARGYHVIVQCASVLPLTFGIVTNYMINIFYYHKIEKRRCSGLKTHAANSEIS